MNFTRLVNPRSLPLVITTMLFALLYGFGALSYDAFLSPQVFINLFHNAAQAMAPQYKTRRGLLRIRAEADDRVIRIFVEDNGPGIPPEKLETIWEAFYTTKPPEEGTGLGLSITRGIIKDHLGHIWAENRLEGGALFIIELPVSGKAE